MGLSCYDKTSAKMLNKLKLQLLEYEGYCRGAPDVTADRLVEYIPPIALYLKGEHAPTTLLLAPQLYYFSDRGSLRSRGPNATIYYKH